MQRVVPSYDPYGGNAAVESSQGGSVGGYALPNAGHEGDGRVEASSGVGAFTGGSVLPEAAGGGEDDNEGFEPMGARNRRRRFGGGGAGGGGRGAIEQNESFAIPSDQSLWFDIGGNEDSAVLAGGYWTFTISPTSHLVETYDRLIYLVLVQGDGPGAPDTAGPSGSWTKVFSRNVSDVSTTDAPYEVWRQYIAAGVTVPSINWRARASQAPAFLFIKHEYFSLPTGDPPFLWEGEDDVFGTGYSPFTPYIFFDGSPYRLGTGIQVSSMPADFRIS